jgi:glycosyltransferase involved in cell wall biosynthesis
VWRRLFERFDAALYCNGANAIFTIVPRILGIPSALNVDGLERKRKKWNALARGWYRASERLSTWFPSAIVTDAAVIERYYAERYGKQSHFIAYGANVGKVASREVLDRFGLLPGGYFLYVSRMEPENNALLVVKAFEKAKTDRRLVMVGDAPYAADYIGQVRDTTDPRILFTGGVYGVGYHELQSHCFAYIHATEVGGTHPALIEAMGRGCPVLFLDTEENLEVAGAAGLAFSKSEVSLAGLVDELTAMPSNQRITLGEKATQVVRERYDWEIITDQYERLLNELARGEG